MFGVVHTMGRCVPYGIELNQQGCLTETALIYQSHVKRHICTHLGETQNQSAIAFPGLFSAPQIAE